jgi:predicted HTH domain antitoxin
MSRLEKFVAQRFKQVRETATTGEVEDIHRIVLHLTPETFASLETAARMLGYSPTACAEELIERAVEDALAALGITGDAGIPAEAPSG